MDDLLVNERPINNDNSPPKKKQKIIESETECKLDSINNNSNELEKMVQELQKLQDKVNRKWNSMLISDKLNYINSNGDLTFLTESEIDKISLQRSVASFMDDYLKYDIFKEWYQNMDISGSYEGACEIYETGVNGNIGPINFSFGYTIRYNTDYEWMFFSFDHIDSSESDSFEIYVGDKDLKKIYKSHVSKEDDIDFETFCDFCSDLIDNMQSWARELVKF